MGAEMTPEAVQALRRQFPAESVGKLPKGGAQLDYVGHAAVTDRLLMVDPEWTWEPVAFAADGAPLIRVAGKDAELWIRLTVCGVTRYGVGTAASSSFDLAKQVVSDAIRNAAMRFGVALDLWSREELEGGQESVEPKITADRAAQIAAVLNRADGATRKAWMDRFRCKPADLPLSLLAAANDWLSDLEPS